MHFCASPQASCGDATMYRHVIHVDVFRILPLERVLLVSWLTEEDKARAGAHPGLVGDAPGLGGPPPDPNADPVAQRVQTGLAGVAGLAEAMGAAAQPGGDGEAAAKKGEKAKKKKKKEAKDDLLEEIQQKSPAERAERSPLELPRSNGSKEKKRKRKSSSSDEGESSDSSFRRPPKERGEDPGDAPSASRTSGIADLAALRGAPRSGPRGGDGQWRKGQASGSSAGVLPAR